jgi:succinate dehydrogenase / fumarate reductase iron-sulfur subunit
MTTVRLRVRRQDTPNARPYWQEFEVPWRKGLNVVSALQLLRDQPVTLQGETVDPVAWEYNCMEEVCGACSMIINGQPRQACSALVDDLSQPVVLEPLAKFPVVRDLLVDRSRMFTGLKQVKAWVELDGSWPLDDPLPRVSRQQQEANYLYSRCMTCGCCMAACPQFGQRWPFLGPATLAQVRLMNAHPIGRYGKTERLHAIMAEGGISDCGNAQVCVEVCPKKIPLTTAIAELGRQVSGQMLRDLLGSAEGE